MIDIEAVEETQTEVPAIAATEYAGFWQRFGAHLIDSCIQSVASIPLLLAA